MNEVKRELYVAYHGQSARFRIIKWIILLAIAYLVYSWKGIPGVLWLFIVGAILGVSLHFILRGKTNGWRKTWGPVKKMRTPYD